MHRGSNTLRDVVTLKIPTLHLFDNTVYVSYYIPFDIMDIDYTNHVSVSGFSGVGKLYTR